MKNLLINKLNEDKESFCQKELLIKEGKVLMLGILMHLP